MGSPVLGEYVADKVVEAIIVKLGVMNEVDRGLLSDTSVTVVDRLMVILGSFKKEYHNSILSIEPGDKDIEKVVSIARRHSVELGVEEVVVLGKARRFIAEKARTLGINLVLDKVLDTEHVKREYGELKQML